MFLLRTLHVHVLTNRLPQSPSCNSPCSLWEQLQSHWGAIGHKVSIHAMAFFHLPINLHLVYKFFQDHNHTGLHRCGLFNKQRIEQPLAAHFHPMGLSPEALKIMDIEVLSGNANCRKTKQNYTYWIDILQTLWPPMA